MSVRIVGPARRRGLPLVDRRLLRARARHLLREIERADRELSIALVDDAGMRSLNSTWRGRDRATDVLAFSLEEGPHRERSGKLLGDVVIGVETADRQARSRRRGLDDEVLRLLVHGALHLVGHDHVRASEARRMRAEERRILRSLRDSDV
jgi:probable rRNA maturation factor